MRAHACLLVAVLSSFLLFQGANAQSVLNQQLSQGFYGLGNQAVSSGQPSTYAFTLIENASYLFAGILIKEGALNMEMQDASGYSYGLGESVIAEDAKPGAYMLTVTGSGKYSVFWDYVQSQKPQTPPAPAGIPADWISLNNRIGTTSFFGYNGGWAGRYLSVTGGQTYWLYIDPSVSGSSVHRPLIAIGDNKQLNTPTSVLWRLNPDFSLNRSVNMGGGNAWFAPVWPKDDPYQGEKLVIKLTPPSDISELAAYWAM